MLADIFQNVPTVDFILSNYAHNAVASCILHRLEFRISAYWVAFNVCSFALYLYTYEYIWDWYGLGFQNWLHENISRFHKHVICHDKLNVDIFTTRGSVTYIWCPIHTTTLLLMEEPMDVRQSAICHELVLMQGFYKTRCSVRSLYHKFLMWYSILFPQLWDFAYYIPEMACCV